MSKRSDFAQKLLDDLRLRKERVGASKSSNRSNAMAIDAYAYSKQTHKGSRNIKTHETIGSRTTNIHNRSSSGSRSSIIEDSSRQVVPYAGGRNAAQIGDLSMALAFAIENGGKLIRTDSSGNNSMLGFLHQIGRASRDFGKMERSIADRQRSSSSRFPTLSHLHIKEISKGAQKLNQILSVCSNGQRYSIEIGKELLKGAMDLEESLRMLVNLQEASEYMVSPQRKNRIVLLEDDEDNEDNTAPMPEQQQLALPRFSFDKPSRRSHNTQEVERNNLKQRTAALTYPTEATNYNQQALITSKSVSHMRSASYSPNIKTLAAVSEKNNHSSSSQSKPEKGRISNVIAKLMGLDDAPQKVDTKYARQKDSTPKQKTEGMPSQHTAHGSTKNAVLKTKDTINLERPKRQKVIEAKRNHVIQDAAFASQAGKNLHTRNASFEAVINNGKPPRRDLEEIHPGTSSEKATTKIEKQQSNIAQLNQNTGSRKNIQDKERKQDDKKHREQNGTGMGNTKEIISREELHQMEEQANKRSEDAVILQGKTGYNDSMLQTEKRYANKLLPNNQEKSKNLGLQQPYILQKPEQQEEKNQGEEWEQQSAKQKLHMSKQRGSEMTFKSSSKPLHDTINMQKKHPHMNQAALSKKSSTEAIDATQPERFPYGRNHEDLVKGKSSTDLTFHMKALVNRNSDQNCSPRVPESEPGREKARIPPVMEEKPVHLLPMQKAKNTKAHKSETPRKIDEVVTRRNGARQNFARPLKHQSSNLQDVKPRRNDKFSIYKGAEPVRANRSKEAESHIVKSNKSVSSIHPMNVAQPTKEAEHSSPLYSPPGDRWQSLKEPIVSPPDGSQNKVSTINNDQQHQAPVFGGDEELMGWKFTSNALTGTTEDSTDISYPSQLEHQKIPKLGMQEPLTESENCLKLILITSELFLNTAEALFKLNIPYNILHASGYICQEEESKLILDCGYEVMKRKGRRQELIIHPCVKISIRSTKVNSLDDLVKQLNKDFETLKLYGRNGDPKCDVEDYLPKMLEIDVHHSAPNVNCMWDSGWDDITSALLEKDDVIRDVERHMLNGLVDEITRDLLQV
uniref:DUF3741 domain-containing protein n=1 Tax=Fagus sylvatica TaxID=28930 RepID=A0A2N9GDJ1_FAGSY